MGSEFGDRALYSGNWLLRAAAAKAGSYGNDAAAAMYPMVKTLPDGTVLDGSKARHTLTFAKDQYPPVNAFDSATGRGNLGAAAGGGGTLAHRGFVTEVRCRPRCATGPAAIGARRRGPAR